MSRRRTHSAGSRGSARADREPLAAGLPKKVVEALDSKSTKSGTSTKNKEKGGRPYDSVLLETPKDIKIDPPLRFCDTYRDAATGTSSSRDSDRGDGTSATGRKRDSAEGPGPMAEERSVQGRQRTAGLGESEAGAKAHRRTQTPSDQAGGQGPSRATSQSSAVGSHRSTTVPAQGQSTRGPASHGSKRSGNQTPSPRSVRKASRGGDDDGKS